MSFLLTYSLSREDFIISCVNEPLMLFKITGGATSRRKTGVMRPWRRATRHYGGTSCGSYRGEEEEAESREV